MLAHRLHLALLLSACVSVAPVGFAGTVTVGPLGSGADFVDVQSAVDASMPGDTVLVAAGTYAPFVVRRGLSVIGAGQDATFIQAFEAQESAVLVEDLPAFEDVLVSGMQLLAETTVPIIFGDGLFFANNSQGTVVVHDVFAHPPRQYALEARNSAQVVAISCDFYSGAITFTADYDSALLATNSKLTLSNTRAEGRSTVALVSAAHAVRLVDSELHVSNSQLLGGQNAPGFVFLTLPHGGHGVVASGSTIVVEGGAGTQVVGGTGGSDGGTPPHQIGDGGAGLRLLDGSVARVQSGAFVVGGLDGTGVQQDPVWPDGTSSFVMDPTVYPTLRTDDARVALGSGFLFELDGNPASYGALYCSFGAGPELDIAGVLGELFLDVTGIYLVSAVSLDAAGNASLNLKVPSSTVFAGTAPLYQWVEIAGGQVALSNPLLLSLYD